MSVGRHLGRFIEPRGWLNHPFFYRTFRRAVSRKRTRYVLVREYIRPHPGDRVLDIGCGPGVLLCDLPDADYTGIDLNERYIAEARRRFGGRGSFIRGTASPQTLNEPGAFDVALAIGVLHHLDDPEAQALLLLAKKALRPGGRFVVLDCCYTERQSRAARFIIGLDRGRHVRTPGQLDRLIGETFPAMTSTVRTDLLRIPYTHYLGLATA